MTQIHYTISIMDYLKPSPIPFKMRGSASQVSSGYFNFSSSRALFCYVRRSKSLIECGSFVILFHRNVGIPCTDCQLPCHIQINIVAVFNSNMSPFLQLLLISTSSSCCDMQVYCYRQILHVREVKLFFPNLDFFLKYKLSLIS